MDKPTKLTAEGLKKLENELEFLKTEGRTEIAEKIKVARGYGDLSENSEYDEAKNDQAKLEARIIELESMLKNVIIIESKSSDTVTLGTRLKVLDVEFDEECEYEIVGSQEANSAEGRISDESPVGRALLGHKAGDEVIAESPAGNLVFKIIEIY